MLGAAALVAAPGVFAQPGKAAGRPITVAQIVDVSPEQQDVSKDFLIGSRAAWQDINARGGVRGRSVQHVSVETDGTAASVRAALQPLLDNPACVVLSGTAGDPVAGVLAGELRQHNTAIAHVAPWLQNSSVDVDDRTFPIFAARQDQINHALKSLTVMGVREVGAVYASPAEYNLYREDLERIASSLKLRLQSFRAAGDLDRLGQRLTPGTPAILLFVGGTPELVQFTQGLEKQQRHSDCGKNQLKYNDAVHAKSAFLRRAFCRRFLRRFVIRLAFCRGFLFRGLVCRCGGRTANRLDLEFIVFSGDENFVARIHALVDDRVGNDIAQGILKEARHRSRAHDGVIPLLGEVRARRGREGDRDFFFCELRVEQREVLIDDFVEHPVGEAIENDDIIEAVQKLRRKKRLQRRFHMRRAFRLVFKTDARGIEFG